jgi:hypothetical protein
MDTFNPDEMTLAELMEITREEAEGAPVDRTDLTEEPGVDTTIELNDNLEEDPIEATEDNEATDEPLTPDGIDATDDTVFAEEMTLTEDGAGEEYCDAEGTPCEAIDATEEYSVVLNEDRVDDAAAEDRMEVMMMMMIDDCPAFDDASPDLEPMTVVRTVVRNDALREGVTEIE